MSLYMICTNYDLPSCKVSPKWRDISATCQAVKTPYMPNGRKLALSSTFIYIYIDNRLRLGKICNLNHF